MVVERIVGEQGQNPLDGMMSQKRSLAAEYCLKWWQ